MQPNFDPKLAAAADVVVAAGLIRRGDNADAIAALEQARAWDPTSPHLDELLARARAQVSTRPVSHAAF
jgi:predicted Zn-dependent protease